MKMGRVIGTCLLVVAFALQLGLLGGFLATAASAATVGWGTPSLMMGDGEEPRVTVDSSGNFMGVWHQDGRLWSSRLMRGVDWSTPTSVPWDGFIEDVAADSDGHAIAVGELQMLRNGSTDSGTYATRFAPDTGWSTPELISSSEGHNVQAQVAVDGAGNAIAVWRRLPPESVWSNRFVPGNGWGIPEPLWAGPTCLFCGAVPKIAMDPFGNALAVWAGNGTLWASRYSVDVGWEAPRPIGEEEEAPPAIAMDPAGNAMVVWDVGGVSPDGRDVSHSIMASRYVSGAGWLNATPIVTVGLDDVADRTTLLQLWLPRVDIDADGNAIVVWGNDEGVFAIRFVPSVGWGTPTPISSATAQTLRPMSSSHQIAVSPEGSAVVAWAETGHGRSNECGLSANRFTPGRGWEGAVPIMSSCLKTGDWSFYDGMPRVAVDLDSAVVVWAAHGNVWANRFLSPSGAILGLDGELREARDALTESIDNLEATRRGLGEAQDALDAATGALADSNGRVILLLGLQTAFAGIAVVLFVMYWNLRQTISGARRNWWSLRGPPKAGGPRTLDRTQRRWPASSGEGSVHLTTKERILLHLLDFARHEEGREAPPEVTRMGIVSAAGVNPRHFAQYVRPLVQKGMVEKRSTHVEGVLQRRNVCTLTAGGMRKALGIRDRVKSAVVRVKDSSGAREASIADVLAATRGSRSILSIVHESIESGFVDLRK